MGEKIEDELAKASERNAFLLKELQHRVRNNLQIMVSLVKLQLTTMLDPSVRKALLTTQRRMHALCVSNEVSLNRQEGDKLELYGLMQEITDSLLDFYDSSARDIIIELTGENIRIMPDFILPLAMITSEIIANTLEHAQQRANLIRLDISWSAKDDGEVSLMYGDVGGGFPEDVIQRLGESLGIMLIRTLAEQIHATISISNSDRGAITSIDFSSGSPQKK